MTVVRTARSDDWSAICRVFAEAGQAGWKHIVPAALLADLIAPDSWNPINGADVLVAEVNGRVVGFAVVAASHDADGTSGVGEIDGFYTHPAVWGLGVGRALLAAATARLRQLGFTQATLWTEHRNERPRRFYENAGWMSDGGERRKRFHDIELLELRYRLKLEAAEL